MIRLRRLLASCAVLAAAFPVFAYAQMPTQIVPCAGAQASGNLPACTVCHLAELAQNILNFSIFLAVFLSAMLFVYAGFLYVTNEAISQQQKAKSLFMNVFVGLIIILASWFVVDTLMKTMVGGSASKFGPWNSICPGSGSGTLPPGVIEA